MVQRLVAGSAMRAATLIFVGVIGGGLRNLEAMRRRRAVKTAARPG